MGKMSKTQQTNNATRLQTLKCIRCTCAITNKKSSLIANTNFSCMALLRKLCRMPHVVFGPVSFQLRGTSPTATSRASISPWPSSCVARTKLGTCGHVETSRKCYNQGYHLEYPSGNKQLVIAVLPILLVLLVLQ